MKLPKKFVGRFFIVVGFLGGAFGGYLSMFYNDIVWYYWAIYVGHLFSWKFLFDYKTGGLK